MLGVACCAVFELSLVFLLDVRRMPVSRYRLIVHEFAVAVATNCLFAIFFARPVWLLTNSLLMDEY